MGILSRLIDGYKVSAENEKALNNLRNSYSIVGRYLFSILSRVEKPYLDKVFDFSEITYSFNQSTFNQLVFDLKFNRSLDEQERKDLSMYLTREFAKAFNVETSTFCKKYKVSIIGNNLFFISR